MEELAGPSPIQAAEGADRPPAAHRGALIVLVIVTALMAIVAACSVVAVTLAGVYRQYAETDEPEDPAAALPQSIDTGSGTVGFAIGDPDAPVTVEEFADFSCPHCHNMAPAIARIIEEYVPQGSVRVVIRPIIFVNPDTSLPAALAGYCTAQQGMFWEMHGEIWDLFETGGAAAYTEANLTARAASIPGLDSDAFSTCYNDPASEEAINAVLEEASERGVDGVPAIFVNGQRVRLRGGAPQYYDNIRRAIDSLLEGQSA